MAPVENFCQFVIVVVVVVVELCRLLLLLLSLMMIMVLVLFKGFKLSRLRRDFGVNRGLPSGAENLSSFSSVAASNRSL